MAVLQCVTPSAWRHAPVGAQGPRRPERRRHPSGTIRRASVASTAIRRRFSWWPPPVPPARTGAAVPFRH